MSHQPQLEPSIGSDAGHSENNLPPINPKPRKPSKNTNLPPPKPTIPEPERDPVELDTIHQLLINPALIDPLRTPRYPIVLSHGAVSSASAWGC
jgi:triacylglycerol lipase